MLVIIITGCILIYLLWHHVRMQRKKHFKSEIPPGPMRWPILGNLFEIWIGDNLPHRYLAKLASKYGNIMSIKIGIVRAVVVSSYEEAKDLMPHPYLIDRITDGVIRDRNMGRNLGINWSNGETWVKIRSFTLRTLKEYGFGKSLEMESIIHAELLDFLPVFSSKVKENSGIVNMGNIFDLTGVNVMLAFMTGKRLSHSDPTLEKLFKLSSDSDKSTNLAASPTIAFPFLRILFPGITGRTVMLEASEHLNAFVRELMGEHRSRSDYATNPQSFMDKFLIEIDSERDKKNGMFTEDQLIITTLDMVQGGSDPISNQLNFAILYMLRHPSVQRKVQAEIDEVVPRSSLPQLHDQQRLVYTEATLLEIFRFGIVLPIPAPRQVTQDFYHRGFLFKKETAVMINLYAIFNDEKVWGDPQFFRPERFLKMDSDKLEIIPEMKNRILAFGLGNRNCPAERVARATLFLYFSALMQNYEFHGVPGEKLPSMDPVLGMTMSPQPYSALIKIRL